MAGQPFDREVWNLLERPLSSDNNKEASYPDQTIRELLLRLGAQRSGRVNDAGVAFPAAGQAAFFGSGFKVRQASVAAMQVVLDAGLGVFNDNSTTSGIGGVVGVDDLSIIKPLTLTAPEAINVPAADPSNKRIDIIEVQFDRRLIDPTSRDVLQPGTGTFAANSVNKTLSFNQNGRSTVNGIGSINYKTGTPGASPSPPAVDAGYTKIAEVDVAAGVTSITTANIRDLRVLWFPFGQAYFAARIIVPLTVSGPATLTDVVAPPGVQLAVQGQGNAGSTGGTVDQIAFVLHLIAGGSPSAYGPPVCALDVSENNGLGTKQYVPVSNALGSKMVNTLGGITSGQFSNPAFSNPIVPVGNGQVTWEFAGGVFVIQGGTFAPPQLPTMAFLVTGFMGTFSSG